MGQRLAKGISDEKKLYVVEMLEKGCTYRQIGQDLGVSNQVIADIKREFFGDDKMRKSIVAGDKFNGLLECVGKNQFKGSVRVKGGKFETKRFIASSSQEAKKLWEKWKDEILEDLAPEITNPPIVVTRANGKTYVPTHPTDRNQEVIKVAVPKKEEPKVEEVAETSNIPNLIPSEPIYLLTLDNPRIAGYLYDEDAARKLMGMLNYALEASGVSIRYNVVPVKYYDKEN